MHELDPIDQMLVDALAADARLGNQELADLTGLSASQCSRRRARLESTGTIRGYRAVIDRALTGRTITAFVSVTMDSHTRENARQFRTHIERLGEVLECHALTGEADYQLKIGVSDLGALSQFLNEQLLPAKSIRSVRSSVVLESIKEEL